MECPILVWMLFLNREINKEEYESSYRVMQTCVPHSSNVLRRPTSRDSARQVIAHLLPLLMMRHRRIPRAKWRDHISPTGKHYIEQDVDTGNNPTLRHKSMIGYQIGYENNIVGMVMTQGRQRDVVNIGLGMKQLVVFPPQASVAAYAESFHHKLTKLEISYITPDKGDEVVLRRLCLLLALKQSYIKAIGQPIGFDWTRLQFDIDNKIFTGDGTPLNGWEFRVWQAHLGIERNGRFIEEMYECACAFFRGTAETTFVWATERKDLDSWVQFINVDQLLNVAPKLTD